MENQSILSDQGFTVDGVIYREQRSLYSVVIQDGPDAGKVEHVLVHIRSIGDKNYTVKKIGFGSDNEQIEEVLEENKMTSLEVAAFQLVIPPCQYEFELENFKNEWEEKWNPTIREDEPGILTRFFKMMNPFA